MKKDRNNFRSRTDELQLLVTNLKGVKIGFDTEFIIEIITPEEVKKEEIEIFSIYRKMDFHNKEAPFTCPKVLLFNPSCDHTAGVMVEAPEDLLTVRTELISLMPPLIREYSKPPAIWGAFKRAEDIILLIDLSKITF